MFWMFVIFLPGFIAVGQQTIVPKCAKEYVTINGTKVSQCKTVTVNGTTTNVLSTEFRDIKWAGPYGPYEMIVGTAILITQVFGIISLAVGLNHGTAGSVQAIENQKTTI